jgi:hypothetical protein
MMTSATSPSNRLPFPSFPSSGLLLNSPVFVVLVRSVTPSIRATHWAACALTS